MRRLFDGFATLMMVVASGALIYVALSLKQGTVTANTSPIYQTGDVFADLQGVDFSQSPSTLVMFVRRGCKFCTESAPFYARLLEMPHRAPVVAMAFDEVGVTTDYLQGLGVKPDRVVQADRGTVCLTGTPALVLVSSKGKVLQVWRGKLSADLEQSVVKSIAR